VTDSARIEIAFMYATAYNYICSYDII